MDQVIDWLNENESRAYPLMEGPKTISDDFLLDAQFVSSTTAWNGLVRLIQVNIAAGTVTVTFDNGGTSLVFTIPNAINEVYPLYLREPGGSLCVFGEGVRTLFDLATAGSLTLSETATLEPSVCYHFVKAWLGVSSIKHAPSMETDVAHSPYYKPSLPLVTLGASPAGLTGDVQLLEGYNFRVSIDDNLIDLEVSSSYGLRMNCTTSFIGEDYADCDDLVSYINGVPPGATGNFQLLAGANVNITQGTALGPFNDPYSESAREHSIFVGLDFLRTDLCAPVNIVPNI